MNLAEIPSDLLPEICNQIPHLIWMARGDGYLQYVNQFGLDYLGVRIEDLSGWNWMQIVHPADRESIMHAWLEAIGFGRALDTRYRMITATGQFRWNLVRARPVHDMSGQVAAYVGTCTDVDDWKQSIRDLSSANREIEELIALLNVYESKAPIGLGFVNQELRYVRLNETLATSNGISVQDHLGRTIRDVLPKLWPTLGPVMKRILETRCHVVDLEVEGETSACPGAQRRWRASYYPVVHADEFLGIALLVVETTNREHLDIPQRSFINEVEGRCLGVTPFPRTPISAA